MMNAPQINHTEYPARLTGLDDDTLQHIINDCRQAIEAMPDNPKAGYYADEIAYCRQELQRRERSAKDYITAKGQARNLANVLPILSGDTIGEASATWQDYARTAAYQLRILAGFYDRASKEGEPEPGSVAHVSAILHGTD